MANLRADNLCGTGFISANNGTVWSDYVASTTGSTLTNYPATYGFDGNLSNFVYADNNSTMTWTAPNGGIKAERIEVYVYAGNTHPPVKVNGVNTGGVVGSATPNQLGNWVDVTDLVDGHLKTIEAYGYPISSTARSSGWAAVRINDEILVDGERGGRSGGREAIEGSILLQSDPKSRISVTNTTGLDFGTDQFTIEFWIYLLKEAPVSKNIFARSTSNSGTTGMIMWFDSNGHLEWDSAHGATGAIHTGAAIGNHMWHHIAVSRDSSNNTRLYLNGVLKGTASSDTTDIVGATNLQIASNIAADGYFNDAYISNFRMVKGTAVYSGTTDFTPPTEKLTAIDGTILLCCQDSNDPTQEASGTGKTITGFGNLDITQTEKINGRFNQDPTGNGWTLHSGASGSYANGQWTVTSPATIWKGAYTSFTSVIGQQYRLTGLVVTSNNWGSISVSNDGGAAKIIYPSWNGSSTFPMTIDAIFTATATTTYISIDNLNTTNTTATTVQYLSVKPVEVGKAHKVLPPVGVDPGVIFEGDTKHNTQSYMYFPTGDTTQRGRGRGVIVAGENPSKNNSISYVQIQSGGIAKDFGDLTKNCGENKALGSSTRGVIQLSGDDPATILTLEYITFATTSNSLDFGDLNAAWWMRATASNETRGLFAGGLYPGSTFKNEIDYITIATVGNAIDFGDLTTARNAPTGCSSSTRMLVAGGQNGPATSDRLVTIEYITIATLGNAPDFGDLTVGGKEGCSAASSTRGVFGPRLAAPGIVNTVDYVTIATLGDAVDFGDGLTARGGSGSLSNSIRGAWAGGYTPSLTNSMEYVDIATTGNAKDFGDLTYVNQYGGGCSDSHGGLA